MALSVVIVDDDAQLRALVRLLLERDDRFVVVGEASDGLEGLSAVEDLDPEVLLLDVQMPRMGGLEVLSQLASRDRPAVVVMTGVQTDDIESRALQAGARAFLCKREAMGSLPDRLFDLLAPEDPSPIPMNIGDSQSPPSSVALQRSEERFRLLVESVVDYAIFMLEPDGTVATWNAGAERLKGYRADEITGRHYSSFYPSESVEAGLPDRLLAEARTNGRTSHVGWRVRKDGSRFWAEVVITALYDEQDTLAGFAKVTRDRTEARLAEEDRNRALEERTQTLNRLQELDQWRRDFVSSISHDLQTPVVAINGFAELMQDESLPEAAREIPDRILSNGRAIQHMLDNLRAYLRLDDGTVDLHLARVELGTLLYRVAADMRPLLSDRELQIEVESIDLVADEDALERVFRNLLTNAVQHTPATTTIFVKARSHGGEAVIDFEDRGTGIPRELTPRVFERFRANGSSGGTGLGLAIAKEYLELHSGTIALVANDKAGATFRCVLPLSPSATS